MKKYTEQVRDDIMKWIEDNADYYNLDRFECAEELAEYLEENIINEVTGVKSGTYTFNSEEAKEYVLNDMDTVINTMHCYNGAYVAEKILNGNYEWLDMRTRLEVFPSVAYEVAKEIFVERGK